MRGRAAQDQVRWADQWCRSNNGDKNGMPCIGFAEPVSSVVGNLGPDGPGAPGNGYNLTWTRPEDLIYSVVCASMPDGPCDENTSTRAGPDTPFH